MYWHGVPAPWTKAFVMVREWESVKRGSAEVRCILLHFRSIENWGRYNKALDGTTSVCRAAELSAKDADAAVVGSSSTASRVAN